MLSVNEYTKRSDQQPKQMVATLGTSLFVTIENRALINLPKLPPQNFYGSSRTAWTSSSRSRWKRVSRKLFKDEPARTDPHFMHAGSTGGELSSELKHVFYCKGPGDSMCTCPACCASGDYTNSKRVWVSEAKIKTWWIEEANSLCCLIIVWGNGLFEIVFSCLWLFSLIN